LTLRKNPQVKRELSFLERVWLGVLVRCCFAMFVGFPPGFAFWAVLGVALIFGSLLVLLVLELLNKRTG